MEIDNVASGNIITVDTGATLAIGVQRLGPSGSIIVSGATFAGGSVQNNGTITVAATSGSSLSGVTFDSDVINTGGITVQGAHGISGTGYADATFEGAVTNTGTIVANSLGNVTFAAGATVTNNSDGAIDANGGTITFDTGHTIENGGLLEATNGGTLDVFDNIDNTGTGPNGIFIGAGSQLLIDGNNYNPGPPVTAGTVSLTGGGDVTLDGGTIAENPSNSLVTGSGAILVLDNVDNTIAGTGQIGDETGYMALTNAGVIDADGGRLALGTGHIITNSGVLEATDGGLLVVQDPIDNSGIGPGAGILVDGTSTLMVGNTDVELSGGGTVTLEAGSKIVAFTSSSTPSSPA